MGKKLYFQYQKELNLPIYICVEPLAFDQRVLEFIAEMQFVKLNEKEEVQALKTIATHRQARVLHISEATPAVSRQIQMSLESDRYGLETITPGPRYRVYRYKKFALMIYSYNAKEWQLGCYSNFANKENLIQARIVINRYLSWSLSPLGILGIWGVAVDDGMVAQRAADAKGEVILIDINNNRLITIDGVKKISPKFKVLRLDPTLKGRNIRMTNEEFISFLFSHCSYFDYSGPSVPVRQMIQAFAKMTEGLVHPQESFRPKTDLSL